MLKKLAYTGVGLVFLASPLLASADQLSDLKAQLQALIDQITAVQLQAGTGAVLGHTTVVPPACVTLTRYLYQGISDAVAGGEVSMLQKFLQKDSTANFTGSVTGFYGSLTVSAVQRWQTAHGIVTSGTLGTTGYGAVGPATRAAMANCGSTTQLPDLTIQSITATNYVPSSNQYVSFNIDAGQPQWNLAFMNNGGTSSNFDVKYAVYNSQGALVTEQTVPQVSTYYLTNPYPFTMLYSYTPGTYTYQISVNPTGGIAESNYGNNKLSGGFNIVNSQVTSLAPSVTSFVTDKPEYQVGETVKFTAKVVDEPGSPFTPGEGASVKIYQVSASGSVNDVDAMPYNSASGYYEHNTSDHTGSGDAGSWSAYVVVLKNGTQVAKSNAITYTVANSAQPKITVVSPNGGEALQVGKTYDLLWTSSGLSGSVRLRMISSDGTQVKTIADSTSNDGKYTWTVPSGQLLGAHRFQVSSGAVLDQSDNTFTFVSSSQVTCPSGYILVNGSCQFDAGLGEVSSCPTGYTLSFGQCVLSKEVSLSPSCTITATSMTPSISTEPFGGYYFVRPYSNVTISWTSQFATSATLNGVAVPTSGSKVFSSLNSSYYNYTLTVKSSSGLSATCSQIVLVAN